MKLEQGLERLAEDGSWSMPEAPAVNPVDSVLSNLVAARELLSDRSRWMQGDYCIDDSFCALGAVLKVAGCATSGMLVDRSQICCEVKILRQALDPKWREIVHHFNDDKATQHADVLALFDRAIASRRASTR